MSPDFVSDPVTTHPVRRAVQALADFEHRLRAAVCRRLMAGQPAVVNAETPVCWRERVTRFLLPRRRLGPDSSDLLAKSSRLMLPPAKPLRREKPIEARPSVPEPAWPAGWTPSPVLRVLWAEIARDRPRIPQLDRQQLEDHRNTVAIAATREIFERQGVARFPTYAERCAWEQQLYGPLLNRELPHPDQEPNDDHEEKP